MNIRESQCEDLNSIRSVHEDAFDGSEGKVVARLACDILADETAMPLCSLVAEDNDKIIGNIIFSSVKIEGNVEASAYILAPLAVSRYHQKKGVGTKLIEYGLRELKKHGVDIVLVLGDPKYYTRVGFSTGHNVAPPYELKYPEAWMALELNPGMFAMVKGVARCGVALSSPEHW